MSHAVPISDEMYRAIEEIARPQGVTPQALAGKLLRERLAEPQAISRQNAEWASGLDVALERATAVVNPTYEYVDALFEALDRAAETGQD